MCDRIKISGAQKLTDQKWLNLFDVAYVDATGHNRSWQIASRSALPKCISGNYAVPDAVIIVPFHTVENKLVITREYRVPLADYEYGFPAGLIDAAESIRAAARRELREETGLHLTRFLKISPAIYSSAGMTDESIAMVYAECEGQPSSAENKGSELIEVQLVNRTQAKLLCTNPHLKFDAKAWLVLSQFAEKGNIK